MLHMMRRKSDASGTVNVASTRAHSSDASVGIDRPHEPDAFRSVVSVAMPMALGFEMPAERIQALSRYVPPIRKVSPTFTFCETCTTLSSESLTRWRLTALPPVRLGPLEKLPRKSRPCQPVTRCQP